MVNEIQVKSILNKHKKRDDWFLDDYSVNPYEGCAFNCIYCYIRGSKYGENMVKTLSAKVNSSELLEKTAFKKSEERGIWSYCLIIFNRALHANRRKTKTDKEIA
jgi:DNA repair photolyase